VSAAYWVLISDDLFASPDTTWPPGLRLLPAPRPARGLSLDGQLPVLRWRQFADEDADPELDGHKVSVVVRHECGRVLIDRRVIE
jgi:hypothetical protein